MGTRTTAAACACALLLLFPSSLPAVTYYKVTDLGAADGLLVRPWDINNSGQIVGYTTDYRSSSRAFLYEGGAASLLSGLPATSSLARQVNNLGQVTGSYYSSVDGAYRAFVHDAGGVTTLGTLPGGVASYGRAINDAGQVAGTSKDANSNTLAFLYSGGTMTSLGALAGDTQSRARDINSSGKVVGFSYTNTAQPHAFVYDSGVMTGLGTLGGVSSSALAINDNGLIVGNSRNAQNLDRAFAYADGVMSDLGTLGGATSYSMGLNNQGQIVGYSQTATSTAYHAFVYGDGTMIDLNSVIDPASTWYLKYAGAINDSGAIVGLGYSPSRQWSGYMLTPIDRPYASLALPSSATLRVLQGAPSNTGAAAISIVEPGNTPTNYLLTSSNVAVSATSGTVAPAAVTDVPLAMGWVDTATTGPRSGSVSLDNLSDPSDPGNHALAVTGAVVANRTLNVAAVGSSATPARAVVRLPRATTVRSGGNPAVDGDDVATRVTTNATGKIMQGALSVAYANTQPGGGLLARFDNVDQTANVSMTFSTTGHYAGSVDLGRQASVAGTTVRSPLLSDGEDSSVGATVQSAVLSYDVNVVEPRKLRTMTSRINFGNVLRGATVSGNFCVTSTNRNPDLAHATAVTVAPGSVQLGQTTVGETLVDQGGKIAVPVSGTFADYGAATVRGSLPVVTAEAAEVGDSTAYRALPVQYTVNVGLAKVGTRAGSFTGATLLKGQEVNRRLQHLSSKVNPTNTLAANPTPASSVILPGSLSGLYGVVGSEAEIVDSMPVSAGQVVSMQWRSRTLGEAHYPGAANSTLPDNGWLVSDVVRIFGLGMTATYALQMSFDNRINLALDGPINGTVANEFPDLYLAKFDAFHNQWVNASSLTLQGPEAELGVLQSLDDFLAANSSYSLAELRGSWGVDPMTSDTGLGHAWAIVQGDGDYAVDPSGSWSTGTPISTPEPSTLVLLACAALALAALRKRAGRG